MNIRPPYSLASSSPLANDTSRYAYPPPKKRRFSMEGRMELSNDQLKNVIGSILEHGEGRKGFMRVNLDQIAGCHITVHKDGDDVLISSYDDGVAARFPLVNHKQAGS